MSCDHNAPRTRLQEATEKLKAEEEMKERVEVERQKKMFAPRKLIGPRDILVNSNLLKIKLEEDVACSSSVKQEPLEVESSVADEQDSFVNLSFPQVKLELDENLVVKVEETLDMEESTSMDHISENCEPIDHNENFQEVASESEMEARLVDSDTMIKLMTIVSDHTDQHMGAFRDLKREIQSNYLDKNLKPESEDNHITTDDILPSITSGILSSILDNGKDAAQLTLDLEETDKKLDAATWKLNFIKSASELAQLPFDPEIKLEDTLACRSAIRNYQAVIDAYWDVHLANLPLDIACKLKEEIKLGIGPLPFP